MKPDRAAFEAAVAQTLEFQRLWQEREKAVGSSDRLSALLSHACSSTPYFQSTGLYSSDGKFDLSQFPIITRKLIASDRLKFLSSLADASEYPLFARTSGTSGRPLTVRFGPVEWYEFTQVSYQRIGNAFRQLNDLALPGELSVVMIHDGSNRQPISTLLFELNYSYFSRMVLRDDPNADADLVAILRDNPVPMLYAKPAYLLKLAYLDEALGSGLGRIKPALLFSSGENLYRDQRQELEGRYGCPLVNAYTSVEGGLIALQCSTSERLHIDARCSFLEILTSEGEIRADGEGEFVLTNLWNWTMPFIRYRTGDHGIVHNVNCECGHQGQTIVRLDGREVGSFQGEFGAIDTQELDTMFMGLGVKQFQLEQQSDGGVELFVVVDESNNGKNLVDQELAELLKDRLGNVTVNVCRVDSIAKRGFKRQRYFSAMKRGIHRLPPILPTDLAAPEPRAIVVSLDGEAERLAVGETDCLVVRNLQGGQVQQVGMGQLLVTCLQFSPTDNILAFGGSNNTLNLWSLADSSQKVAALETADRPMRLAFSLDGLILVAGGEGGHVQAWELDKDHKIPFTVTGQGQITALATSLVSRLVAISSDFGNPIQVRTLPDLELFAEVGTTGLVNSMAFMMDENILGVGFADGRVELWTIDTGTRVTQFRHGDAVSHLAFCQSTQTLVAGNEQGEVRLWDVWRGQEKACFQAHLTPVKGIAFPRDGRGYLTLGRDASVRQWNW
jgi:phenylacetate-CoA ligase